MEILGMIVFWLFLIIGILSIPFGLPGTFIIVADALVYGLITHFEKISLGFVGILLLIAVVLEIIEALMGALMAKKFGGSKWGIVGAMVGVFVGAVIGTAIVPVLGTLLGAFCGAFIGASLLEGFHTQDWQHASKVGLGALFGAVGGKMTKIMAAIVMVIMIGFKVFA
jgi:uncharacterized protein YqgC (DUF456 family)